MPRSAANLTDGQLLASLSGSGNAYIAFLISFIVIGSHWRQHHRLFRSVSRIDSRVAILNMAWLFMIVITPFAARVLSGDGAFAIRFSFYSVIQILTLLCFLAIARELRNIRPVPAERPDDARLVAFAAVFAISIPVAFVTHWAYLCWIAGRLLMRIPERLRSLRAALRRPDAGAA